MYVDGCTCICLSVFVCLSVCMSVWSFCLFISTPISFLIKIFLSQSSLLLLYSFNIFRSPESFSQSFKICLETLSLWHDNSIKCFLSSAFKFSTIILHNKRKKPVDFQITPFCLSVCMWTSLFATISISHCQREIILVESWMWFVYLYKICTYIHCVWMVVKFFFLWKFNTRNIFNSKYVIPDRDWLAW